MSFTKLIRHVTQIKKFYLTCPLCTIMIGKNEKEIKTHILITKCYILYLFLHKNHVLNNANNHQECLCIVAKELIIHTTPIYLLLFGSFGWQLGSRLYILLPDNRKAVAILLFDILYQDSASSVVQTQEWPIDIGGTTSEW